MRGQLDGGRSSHSDMNSQREEPASASPACTPVTPRERTPTPAAGKAAWRHTAQHQVPPEGPAGSRRDLDPGTEDVSRAADIRVSGRCTCCSLRVNGVVRMGPKPTRLVPLQQTPECSLHHVRTWWVRQASAGQEKAPHQNPAMPAPALRRPPLQSREKYISVVQPHCRRSFVMAELMHPQCRHMNV